MDKATFRNPTFIVALATLAVLLVSLLLKGVASTSEASRLSKALDDYNVRLAAVETAIRSEKPNEKELDEAISLAKSQIGDKGFQSAYDTILVASRLGPSDSRVLDLVVQFTTATAQADDDALMLAEDLVGRAESLVHYRSPKNVMAARKQFDDIAEKLHRPSAVKLEPPTAEVDALVRIAEDTARPIQIRSRSAEQARLAFDELLQASVAGDTKNVSDSSAELEALRKRLDVAEQSCIAFLFEQSSVRAKKWLADSAKLLKDAESAKKENVPKLSGQIDDSLEGGMTLGQEIVPYVKSEVAGAKDLMQQIERRLKTMQRTKTWLYNQQVLRLVRDVESQKSISAEDKIRHLADVSEELLSPYVLRRHNEMWDKAFEDLKDEEKKVWAVRLRILQVKE